MTQFMYPERMTTDGLDEITRKFLGMSRKRLVTLTPNEAAVTITMTRSVMRCVLNLEMDAQTTLILSDAICKVAHLALAGSAFDNLTEPERKEVHSALVKHHLYAMGLRSAGQAVLQESLDASNAQLRSAVYRDARWMEYDIEHDFS